VTETHEVAWLAEQFERNRPQLRALAYRLLGPSPMPRTPFRRSGSG
jgi:hypothetical protein